MKIAEFNVALGTKNANKEVTQLIIDGAAVNEPAKYAPQAVLDYFRSLPRISTRSNGAPRVMFDGVSAQLGYWAMNASERAMYSESRKGGNAAPRTNQVSVTPNPVREELLKFSAGLAEEQKTELLNIVEKFFPDPRKAKINALEAQIAALKAQLAAEE